MDLRSNIYSKKCWFDTRWLFCFCYLLNSNKGCCGFKNVASKISKTDKNKVTLILKERADGREFLNPN